MGAAVKEGNSVMSEDYVPPGHGEDWRRAEPGETGLDPAALAEAASFAERSETPWARDLEPVIGKGFFEPPPWNEIIGEGAPRGRSRRPALSGNITTCASTASASPCCASSAGTCPRSSATRS